MCAKNSHKKRFFYFLALVTLCQKLLCYRWISLCCIACYRLPLLVLEGQEQQRNGARKITIYSTAADICKNETYFPGPFISATTAEIINSVVRLDLRALFKLCKQLKHFLMLLITNINLCCHVDPPLQIVLLFCLFSAFGL